jgi:hypothetical protein
MPAARRHSRTRCASAQRLQVDPERGEGRIRPQQLGGREVGEHTRLGARLPEGPHHDLDVLAERFHELGYVNTCPAIDLGWILSGNHIDAHMQNVLRNGV